MIYVLIGPPAVGKTTHAHTMVRFINAVIISRDNLREMLHGYRPELMPAYYDREDLDELEKTVTDAQDTLIKQALKSGKHVILDNTHLRLKYINDLKKYNVPLRFVLLETDLETALYRDDARTRHVGEDFIRKAFGELEHLKKNFDFKNWNPEPIEPINYPSIACGGAFVFDLDGTLALRTGDRSPFDWKRVGEDEVNEPVKKVLDTIAEYGWEIIICSGRDAVCRPETEKWLTEHQIEYQRLYMRPEKDNRKDYIVKEEIWREIIKEFNILAMFDDRDQVVEHGRKLGFPMFQVQEGNF